MSQNLIFSIYPVSRAQCRRFYRRWLTFDPDPHTGIVEYDSIMGHFKEQTSRRSGLSGSVMRTMFRFYGTSSDKMHFTGFINCLALFRHPEKSEQYDCKLINSAHQMFANILDFSTSQEQSATEGSLPV